MDGSILLLPSGESVESVECGLVESHTVLKKVNKTSSGVVTLGGPSPVKKKEFDTTKKRGGKGGSESSDASVLHAPLAAPSNADEAPLLPSLAARAQVG